MRGVPRTLLACAAIALLGLALSACGGDSDDSTATTGTSAGAPANGAASAGGSASFATPGGDNSIQQFGEEADDSELEAANDALVEYMEARASDDWKGQCTYLANAAVASLVQLAAGSPQFKGKGCEAILEALLSSAPPSTRANTMTEGMGALRVEGERGFALYHGAKGVNYFVPMVEEDGEWKVGALAPAEFP